MVMVILFTSDVHCAQVKAVPIMAALDFYVSNIFIYYTWNTSFVLCALWGAVNIVFTADRGLAYSTCISNFHSVFAMNGSYIN